MKQIANLTTLETMKPRTPGELEAFRRLFRKYAKLCEGEVDERWLAEEMWLANEVLHAAGGEDYAEYKRRFDAYHDPSNVSSEPLKLPAYVLSDAPG